MAVKGLSMNTNKVMSKIMEARIKVRKYRQYGEGQGGSDRWPFNFMEIDPYFLDIWAKSFWFDAKEYLKSHSLKEFSKFVHNPSALWEIIIHGHEGLEKAGLQKEELDLFLSKMVDTMKLLKRGEIFFEDDTNKILDDGEINKLQSNLNKNRDISINKLITILTSYVYVIYSHWDCYSMEIHGPYKVKDGVIIVRDFFNLRPQELFDITKNFPFDKIKIVTLYKNIKIKFDIYNHILTDSNLYEEMKAYSIYFNGKMNNSRILETIDNAKKLTLEISEKWNSRTKKEKAKMYVDEAYYGLKEFRKFLGKDWVTPQIIIKRLNKITT